MRFKTHYPAYYYLKKCLTTENISNLHPRSIRIRFCTVSAKLCSGQDTARGAAVIYEKGIKREKGVFITHVKRQQVVADIPLSANPS